MATGPQRYPGASTTHWHQTRWGGDLMEVNVCVLHSTEGIGLPNYDGGGNAPNLTAVADFANKRLRWFQHFDIDRSSRALRNLAGGVATNTLNATQVELDGTCDYSKRTNWGSRVAGRDYIYWGDPPDWALRDLAELLRWLNANHAVPLTGPSMWLTYGPDTRRAGITPASYGASPARMSFSSWTAFKGICGHQHVPENDHGDPGSLPFAKLIALAKGDTIPEEDDVPLTDAEVDKIARRVLTLDGVIANPVADPNNPHIALASAARNIEIVARRTEAAVKALPAVELTDVQIATLASAVAANPALAEQIAEKVAVKLAERLAD